MKIATLLVVLLLCPAYFLAQECMFCRYDITKDIYHCEGTCTSSGEGCGGCCYRQQGGQVCWVGGCCYIVPGVGGVCYDKTGASCGNFSCQGITSPVQASDTRQPTHLNTVNWVMNTKFPAEIGRYSKSFEKVLTSFQLIVSSSPEQTVRENDVRKFNVVVRRGFPVMATVSHATTDKWVLSLDRADTEKEGVRAPIMLEIVGNQWTLISHAANKEEKFVVGSGTIE